MKRQVTLCINGEDYRRKFQSVDPWPDSRYSMSGNSLCVYLFFCLPWMFFFLHGCSVVPLLSMFLPKFYHGSLGMHPASVNENVFMQLRLSITHQQLTAAPRNPTPRIYNINGLLLSTSPQHEGVCVGHLGNSSQWALVWEWSGGAFQAQSSLSGKQEPHTISAQL